MTELTTWDSWRKSDDSTIKICFDWHDDHSSWRLDEAKDTINEAIKILELAGELIENPKYVYDLANIAKSLRRIHVDEKISDAVVRRALNLADLLDFGQYCESDDASFSYECTIENATEILQSWDQHQTWTHTDEDWDVSAVTLFDKQRNSRNGLGDNWSMTIDDDSVELPDGTIIKGIRPSDMHRKLFDEITIDLTYVDEEKFPNVAAELLKVPNDLVDRLAQAICNIAAGRELHLDAKLVAVITDVITRHDIEQFERIVETAANLGGQWLGEEHELITASEMLVCS